MGSIIFDKKKKKFVVKGKSTQALRDAAKRFNQNMGHTRSR